MKALSVFFLIILFAVQANSQSWAPIGAEWHYENQYMFSNTRGFFHFESIKDTIVSGKNCREIRAHSSYFCIRRSFFPIYTYNSNDSVFILNYADTANPKFELYYNWNANPGDSWQIVGLGPSFWPYQYLDTTIIYVDSIGTTQINGMTLRQIHVGFMDTDSVRESLYPFTLTEKIGNFYYMFITEWSDGMCDLEYPNGLRCYQDDEIGFYMHIQSDSCNQIKDYTGIENKTDISKTRLYPNPCRNNLTIDTDLHEFTLMINDTHGKILLESEMNGSEIIDVSWLSPGIYQVKIFSDQGLESRKVIVE